MDNVLAELKRIHETYARKSEELVKTSWWMIDTRLHWYEQPDVLQFSKMASNLYVMVVKHFGPYAIREYKYDNIIVRVRYTIIECLRHDDRENPRTYGMWCMPFLRLCTDYIMYSTVKVRYWSQEYCNYATTISKRILMLNNFYERQSTTLVHQLRQTLKTLLDPIFTSSMNRRCPNVVTLVCDYLV